MEVGGSQDVLENKNEENDFEKNGSSDPVVYQLVRVECDGTLVPATDDEVLQFEHFLHDEKVDLPSIEDEGHVEEFFTKDCMLLKKPDLEAGSSKLETTEVQTQKLDADLEEDRVRPSDDPLHLPSKCTVVHNQQIDILNTEQQDNNIFQQDNASTKTTKSTVLNYSCSAEKEKADACSRPVNDTSTRPFVSEVTSSVPDFSILREVCLDNLTIRELQEAFRATFGRQTTVKDKLWLKRQITMGLTNSCGVPNSGCVVKDYKIVGKDAKQEIPATEGVPKVELEATSLARDQALDTGNERDLLSSSYYHGEDQQGSSKRLKRVPTDNDEPQGTLLAEQGTAKRIRKPTKRYIEELSDIETNDSTGKLFSPGKRPAHDEVLRKPRVTPFREIDSLSTTYPTRKDTLGGFSVHVPYVPRMRRGRPRRDFIPFLDHEPSVECTEVQTAVEMMLEKDGEQGNHASKAVEVPLTKNAEKKGGHIETTDSKEVQTVQANDFCSADAIPKIKRGLKRKHHRAWTLCEVLKLVDGVARYGAGKWSEIRRLAFASYSYRTSVDLKDKWRNLIRTASQTQLHTEKDRACPRKNNPYTIPIPPSILLRVKELAGLQSQAGDLVVPIKLSGQSSKVVQGKRSGFL
uniref:MYB1 n=1 Tax=Bambusa emeiensis TaxID=280850 RepID=A0A139Z3B7_BAMEM|nr:MYB1 [Bambusa emeiensis]